MARAHWLKDVLEDLRRQGVPVHYVNGYAERGSDTFDPRGIICHDTGGSANSTDAGEINVLLHGSNTAPPPIAQIYLSRTTGVHLAATGRCNHARTGRAGPLKNLGNTNLIGIEAAANPGRAWPAQQYRWYVLLVAAILRNRGWGIERIAAHREHQPGEKVDPQGIDMGRFRADIRAAMGGAAPTTTPEGDDMSERASRVIEAWSVGKTIADDGQPVEPVKWQIRMEEWQKKVDAALKALADKPTGSVTLTAADRDAIVAGLVSGLAANPTFLEAVAKAVADEHAERQKD